MLLVPAPATATAPAQHVREDVQGFQLHSHVFLLGDGAGELARDLPTHIAGQSRACTGHEAGTVRLLAGEGDGPSTNGQRGKQGPFLWGRCGGDKRSLLPCCSRAQLTWPVRAKDLRTSTKAPTLLRLGEMWGTEAESSTLSVLSC